MTNTSDEICLSSSQVSARNLSRRKPSWLHSRQDTHRGMVPVGLLHNHAIIDFFKSSLCIQFVYLSAHCLFATASFLSCLCSATISENVPVGGRDKLQGLCLCVGTRPQVPQMVQVWMDLGGRKGTGPSQLLQVFCQSYMPAPTHLAPCSKHSSERYHAAYIKYFNICCC